MKEKELNKQNGSSQEDENKIPIERTESTEENSEKQIEELNTKEAELKKALEKNTESEKQILELKDMLLRKVAEFENYKRRNENDQMNILKYAAETFIVNVLPIYDDMERSLAHIDDESNFESTKKGLVLVFEKFNKILENQGVKRIEAKGKPFDVNYHEALMQQPVEGVPPHTVLDVIEPGYIYKDRVIRHAKVIVSAELASPEEPDTNNQTEENKEDK